MSMMFSAIRSETSEEADSAAAGVATTTRGTHAPAASAPVDSVDRAASRGGEAAVECASDPVGAVTAFIAASQSRSGPGCGLVA
ncbi:hypothetical protein ABID43_005058 [Methylobacterium goesingense]|uniref:Uncharacterized protein n=1 Tax=Methylobacterium goesingense TaxID=243690 RepID=A0ABV2LFI6_9HYPH|nr:hypothetical protein [Methylobacterium goesingense]